MKKMMMICIAVMLLVFSACGKTDTVVDNTGETTVNVSGDTVSGLSAPESLSEVISSDDMFTDRDLSESYVADAVIQLADSGSAATGDNVDVDGNIINITAAGVYELSGSLSDGEIIVNAEEDAKVQLVLNNASVTNDTHAAIYVSSADKVFITSPSGTKNDITFNGVFAQTDTNNVDGAIFSKGTVTFNGAGALTVRCDNGHGVVSKDDLKIAGTVLSVEAGQKGLNINDSFRMAFGSVDIVSGEQGIKVQNDEDTAKGFVYMTGGSLDIDAAADGINASAYVDIRGGEMEISSGDDGIHSDTDVSISGGKVNVSESYEGIEGTTITISGGDVSVRASDDGLNCGGGNDSSGFGGGFGRDMFAANSDALLTVSGGNVTVNADGDGLDSNGYLRITGGNVFVSGPANGGNGSLDYGSGAEITGGTLICAGAAGMQENFTSASQGVFLVNLTGNMNAGTGLTVYDSAGNALIEFTPEQNYRTVLFSSPELKVGETYTVSSGGTDTQITLDSTITGTGTGMGGGMQGGMFGGQQGMPPGMNGQENGNPSQRP